MIKFQALSPKLFTSFVILILCAAAFLRLYRLDSLPPSLYWEEAALGYDAYSIAQTGKDHHGTPYPLIAFTSFGDYKPSGYFYAIVPFIKLFGLNAWAVRLPSALAGISTVWAVGYIVRLTWKQLWPKASQGELQAALLSGLFVASISSWLIQFSRGGWEVNFATALLSWSVVAGLSVLSAPSRKTQWMIVSVLLAVFSMYVYHATRVIAPALQAGLFLLWALPTLSKRNANISLFITLVKKLLLPAAVFLIVALPLLLSSRDQATQQRFAETSLTGDGNYVTLSNYYREVAGNTPLSRVFTHRYLILGQQIATAFLSHFTPDFLFISGDSNPRHSTGFTGILALTDALWLVIGGVVLAYFAWKEKYARPILIFLAWWLFVGVLPAAVTKAFPHALRTLPAAPVFLTVVSIGFLQTLLWLKKTLSEKLFILLTFLLFSGLLVYWGSYWRYYTRIYPVISQADWQYGYKEMVQQLNQTMSEKPSLPVFVTREYGRPAMYYWFYSQTSPATVQAEEATATKDQAEFLSYQNMYFINTVNEAKPGIVVSSENGFAQLSQRFALVQKLDEVRDLRGQIVWVIAVVDQPIAQ